MTPADIKEQLRRKREAKQGGEASPPQTREYGPPVRHIEVGNSNGCDHPERTSQRLIKPFVSDKIPQSMDAEKGVIGSILLAPIRCMTLAQRRIGREYFLHPSHRDIWEALAEMHHDCTPIHFISLTQYLQDTGRLGKVGGAAYITELFTFVPTASNIPYYLEIIREKFTLRKLAELADWAKQQALNPGTTPQIAIEAFQGEIASIARLATEDADDIETHTFSSLAEIDTKHDPNSVLGYRWLCRGGSCLIVGQSGIGKSSLGVQAGSGADSRWRMALSTLTREEWAEWLLTSDGLSVSGALKHPVRAALAKMPRPIDKLAWLGLATAAEYNRELIEEYQTDEKR